MIVLLAALAAACGDHRLVLHVGPERVTCTGVGQRLCLLVRAPADDDWRLFYDPIRGFDWEPGYYYALLVSRRQVSPIAADASSIRWTLIRILDRVPADAIDSTAAAGAPSASSAPTGSTC